MEEQKPKLHEFHIKADNVIALFKLPMPAEGFGNIHTALCRIYGEADYMMSMHGEYCVLTLNGEMPMKASKVKFPPKSDGLGEIFISGEGDKIVNDLTSARFFPLVESAFGYFNHFQGINYVSHRLQHPVHGEFEVVIQRVGGLTPAEKLTVAEERIKELEAQLGVD